MIRITVTGTTITELRANLVAIHAELIEGKSGSISSATTVVSTSEKLEKAETKKAAKKDSEKPAGASKTQAEANGETEAPTKEECTAALQKVGGKLGIGKAGEIVKKFGAARVAGLTPGQYPAFIAACNEALA